MSSSAFFIEAAANTMRLLSCARAGEKRDPERMGKAARSPGRRCIMALHTCLRRIARANQALVMVECDRRKRRSGNPEDLRSVRTSRHEAYLIVEARKRLWAASMVRETADSRLFGGRYNRNADRVGLDARNLDDERLWRNFEFHALANSFTAPHPAGGDRAEKLSVLNNVDPAGGRQVDRVPPRRKPILECCTSLKGLCRP